MKNFEENTIFYEISLKNNYINGKRLGEGKHFAANWVQLGIATKLNSEFKRYYDEFDQKLALGIDKIDFPSYSVLKIRFSEKFYVLIYFL